jgi:hypothetical protein
MVSIIYILSYNLESWNNQDICLWIVPHEAHSNIELSIHIRSTGKEI